MTELEKTLARIKESDRVIAEMSHDEARIVIASLLCDYDPASPEFRALVGVSYVLDSSKVLMPWALAQDCRRCLNQIRNTKVNGLSEGKDTYSVASRLDKILGFPRR